MTTQEIKDQATGQWESIAIELRPSSGKNADGTLKPFYLRRKFNLAADDRFELILNNYADPYGNILLAELRIQGHILWQGDHRLIAGAQQVDFIADENYRVTPLNYGFAAVRNQFTKGFERWTTEQTQRIFKRNF